MSTESNATEAGHTELGPADAGHNSERRTRWQRWTVRTKTLVVGTAISAALLIAAVSIPVPYVALGPGSAFDTLASGPEGPVITFSGSNIPASADDPTDGNLNILTVRVVDHVPMMEAAMMWASGNYEFAPRVEYYPSGHTKEEITERNVQMFRDSQSAAEIQALWYLGYPTVLYVGTIEEGSPSWDLLNPQDQIVGLNDATITDFESLKAVLATTRPGDTVTVHVLRDGKPAEADIELGANPDLGSQGVLGIEVAQRPQAPFDITIALEDIGGPSAGLMFTLGIIDRLTEGGITGGAHIAGTGTMQMDGSVGAIGGVTMKERAAHAAGADYMLLPAANCEEALTAVPDGLTLVPVRTLQDAVEAVSAIADGGQLPSCSDGS